MRFFTPDPVEIGAKSIPIDPLSSWAGTATNVEDALIELEASGSSNFFKVKVSSNDTTGGYLNGKLVAGNGIAFTENNNGGNETLTVEFNAATADVKVKVSSDDTTTNYLEDKLAAGAGISFATLNPAGNEQREITCMITQYTDEMAQDTVGGILTDTATINFTYTDATPSITADVIQSALDHGSIGGLTDDDHIGYLLVAGTRALTGNWDAGSYEIRAQTFQSDVVTGTAPLIVASTTLVTNLNADLLDGQSGAYYLNNANVTGILAVGVGGTGKSSWTQYLIPYADTTTSFGQIAIGTSGQVLTSNGAGVAPTFQTSGASGANTALSNLASVAINLSLISDTDITDDLGSMAIRWKDVFSATLNTGDTAGDTLKLRGYDVDGAAFVDILTITANNTVTGDINTGVTIGGSYIYRNGGTDIAVADGGTGLSSYTANNLLYASGTTTIAGLATANSGLLITSGAGVPSIATDIPTAVTIGSAYIYRVGGTDVAVADGGTGKSSWTQYLIPYADTTTSFGQIAIGTSGQVLTSNGAGAAPTFQAGGGGGDKYPCEGRLTLTSGTPVTTADVTAAGTIYFTPYKGDQIALYSGSAWATSAFTELSLALTLTANKNYDVFIYDNAGTLTLELSAEWTNDTTRAGALVLQNGVYCKSGALTRRYLGTIRASATNQTEDSASKRFVWNMYNRVSRHLSVVDTTNTWTYTTDAWRPVNGATAGVGNCVHEVRGLNEGIVVINTYGNAFNNTGAYHRGVGVGISSGTVNSAQCMNSSSSLNQYLPCQAAYAGFPGIGYYYYQWIERDQGAGGTTTWVGDGGLTFSQQGLIGKIIN